MSGFCLAMIGGKRRTSSFYYACPPELPIIALKRAAAKSLRSAKRQGLLDSLESQIPSSSVTIDLQLRTGMLKSFRPHQIVIAIPVLTVRAGNFRADERIQSNGIGGRRSVHSEPRIPAQTGRCTGYPALVIEPELNRIGLTDGH